LSTVFIGTSEFAAAVLERLARAEVHRPALIITRPDRPAGRGRRLSSPPVADAARALDIALEQPSSVNQPAVSQLIAQALASGGGGAAGGRGEAGGGGPSGGRTAAGRGGDAGGTAAGRGTVVVCAFGALIKEPLLTEHRILNVHPSLLPRWRGAAPVERAIMAGDQRTGVSIMRLTAGLDSGPVCLAAEEPIHPDDTYGTLAHRLDQLGGELLVRALDEHPPFVEQSDDGVTYAEKLTREDRLLDPARPAVELERVVRALHPHVGARVQLDDGTMLGVHRAALAQPVAAQPDTHSTPGLSFGQDGRLLLGCTPGTLELLVVQPPGGRAMDASAYLRGRR